jgi:hypothetical protein
MHKQCSCLQTRHLVTKMHLFTNKASVNKQRICLQSAKFTDKVIEYHRSGFLSQLNKNSFCCKCCWWFFYIIVPLFIFCQSCVIYLWRPLPLLHFESPNIFIRNGIF